MTQAHVTPEEPTPDHTIWIGGGWHPPRKNVYHRCHWAKKRWYRKGTATALFYAAADAKATYATTKRRIRLTVIMEPGQRAGDPDGYVECFLDAMQDAGLLINDNYRWCEMLPVQIDRSTRKHPKEAGTRVEIWDI